MLMYVMVYSHTESEVNTMPKEASQIDIISTGDKEFIRLLTALLYP